jgi:hypothetical protein
MTKTPTRRHRPGFGASLGPDAIIKNLRSNIYDLRGDNIHSTVANSRAYWDADYPYRDCKPFTKEELFRDRERVIVDVSKDQIVNPERMGIKSKFRAYCGAWGLTCAVDRGHKDFTFTVFAGDRYVFHPLQAKANILRYHDEETFREWKRFVMSQWGEASTWLIQVARNAIPGFTAWSVTCCDSSERLMKNCPRVEVRNHVAFLYL